MPLMFSLSHICWRQAHHSLHFHSSYTFSPCPPCALSLWEKCVLLFFCLHCMCPPNGRPIDCQHLGSTIAAIESMMCFISRRLIPLSFRLTISMTVLWVQSEYSCSYTQFLAFRDDLCFSPSVERTVPNK